MSHLKRQCRNCEKTFAPETPSDPCPNCGTHNTRLVFTEKAPASKSKIDKENHTMTCKQWQQRIHQWAMSKGWWESERNTGEIYVLFHSELSEAFEHWREHRQDYFVDPTGKPDGEAIELADAIIRILDYAESRGWDMDALIELKMKYNDSRPYRHGGKKA